MRCVSEATTETMTKIRLEPYQRGDAAALRSCRTLNQGPVRHGLRVAQTDDDLEFNTEIEEAPSIHRAGVRPVEALKNQ
jgi:hypothetical protein